MRHWRVNGKCLSAVLPMGRSGRRNLLFYVTLHWMLVCCGYDYLNYFLVTSTGDHNFNEWCNRSQTPLRTLTEETRWRQRKDEEAEVKEWLLYLNWMAGPRTVSLCDMMWSLVPTVWTDSSWWENTPKKSLRVRWSDRMQVMCRGDG